MINKKDLSRREFVSRATTIAGSFYLGLPWTDVKGDTKKSRVILIRDEKILDHLLRPDSSRLEKMLDTAVSELLDENDHRKAWGQLIQSEDIVGIKTNQWNRLATPPALEAILKNKVLQCGVKEKNISIDDRGIRSNSVFQRSTALINVRPMRTHAWSGLGSLIKNYIMFVDSPSAYHGDSCADLATIWKLPVTKGKTRLNILVMLTPLFHGIGPHHYNPEYVWPYNGLIVGIDPVAVDATGMRIIQAKREEFFKEIRPINPPPKHILVAETRHQLGVADAGKIDLVRLGWEKDSLI